MNGFLNVRFLKKNEKQQILPYPLRKKRKALKKVVKIMKKIQAKKITVEGFRPYGSFMNILNPTGNHLGDFYNDQVLYPVSGAFPVAFSPLIIHKPAVMKVTMAEYHNTTGECMLAMDDDVIIHVAPPTKDPVSELTEAFIVPQGTFVQLNTGVWHNGAFPINKDEAHLLIVLPERIYMNDCRVVEYETDAQIVIVNQ